MGFALPRDGGLWPDDGGGRPDSGADSGYVYALDQRTGCVHWAFQAQAGVRSAVTVGPLAGTRQGAFFGDLRGNVYAIDAATGALVWTRRVDDHPLARITASPMLYRDRLYVSVASLEEGAGTSPRYPCCTSVQRGALRRPRDVRGRLR